VPLPVMGIQASFVPAREPGNIPRMLLSSTPWFSDILGQSGDLGSTHQGEVSVLGRLDMFATKEPQSCLALVRFQGRGCADGVRPAFGYALILEALIFQ
jgi:hypothetical protein